MAERSDALTVRAERTRDHLSELMDRLQNQVTPAWRRSSPSRYEEIRLRSPWSPPASAVSESGHLRRPQRRPTVPSCPKQLW